MPAPIDFSYVIEQKYALAKKIIIPSIITVAGIYILISLENASVEPLKYLLLFLLGVYATIGGIIWSSIIIFTSMKKTIKEDHIIKNTKDGMRQKTFRYFYWTYAIASLIGLIVAITKDNEAYVYQIPTGIIFIGLILWLVDSITKRNKKN